MLHSYLARYRDPHRGLRALRSACREAGVRLLRVPMHSPLQGTGPVATRLGPFLGKVWGHLGIVAAALRYRQETLVVREFLTVPLFLVAPLLWARRRSVWFLCHHNLSMAQHKPAHRWMLQALHTLGFGFMTFETRSAWEAVGPPRAAGRIVSMPYPLVAVESRAGRDGDTVIGFVGNYRKEKSPDWALKAIVEAQRSGVLGTKTQLLIGTSDAAFREQWAARAVVIDTTTEAAYTQALRTCDIVVLPYDEEAYAYRVSGVLADAVAAGAVVVAPDLPILRDQLMLPASVGACYASRAALEDAVVRAMQLLHTRQLDEAFRAHESYRSIDGLKRALQPLVHP